MPPSPSLMCAASFSAKNFWPCECGKMSLQQRSCSVIQPMTKLWHFDKLHFRGFDTKTLRNDKRDTKAWQRLRSEDSLCAVRTRTVEGRTVYINWLQDSITKGWSEHNDKAQWRQWGGGDYSIHSAGKKKAKGMNSQNVTAEKQPWNLRWAREEPEGALCSERESEGRS